MTTLRMVAVQNNGFITVSGPSPEERMGVPDEVVLQFVRRSIEDALFWAQHEKTEKSTRVYDMAVKT